MSQAVDRARTYMLYQGQQVGVAERVLKEGLTVFGESEWGLLNRPARWEALLGYIMKHPIGLKFTNIEDISYMETPNFAQTAAPHNLVITLGVYFGIPGLIIGLILIAALLNSLLKAITNSKPQTRPITLAAFGIVCGFLFRNMWSNALLTWPIEITLFSLAILAAWQAEKGSAEKNDPEAELVA